MIKMYGAKNIPGAPGVFRPEADYLSASNPLTDPRFKIPGGQPWNPTPLLPGKDTKKFEERPLTKPFQLPSAMVGNIGGMLAQADPNAAALGGLMQAGGVPPGFGMQAAPNVPFVRPSFTYDQEGLEIGGAVNLPIGEQGRINVQGGYRPETRQLNVNATLGQPRGSRGFGIDVNVNRTLGSGGRNDYGAGIRYETQF